MKAVGIVIENKEGKILILKRHITANMGGKWGLPGGVVDAGENYTFALIREMKEEIGVEIMEEELEFLSQYDWLIENEEWHFKVYKTKLTKDIEIILQLEESTEYDWINLKDFEGREDITSGLSEVVKLYRMV